MCVYVLIISLGHICAVIVRMIIAVFVLHVGGQYQCNTGADVAIAPAVAMGKKRP